MSSQEARLAALYEGKSSPIDLRDMDRDFASCILARTAMSRPCSFMQNTFTFDYENDGRACWGGHLILHRSLGATSAILCAPDVWGRWIDRVAQKLGFKDCSDIYRFNDDHTHSEVLAEFDKRLQAWE